MKMRYVQLHERCLCVLHLQSLGLQPDQKDCARSHWSCIQHFARILQKKSLSMSTNFTWECDWVLSSNNQTQQFHWMTWPVISAVSFARSLHNVVHYLQYQSHLALCLTPTHRSWARQGSVWCGVPVCWVGREGTPGCKVCSASWRKALEWPCTGVPLHIIDIDWIRLGNLLRSTLLECWSGTVGFW